MNYIREAEKHLRYYGDLEKSLKNIEKEITKLKWLGIPKDIKAMDLDGMPKANKIQDDMVNIIYKLKCYTEIQESTLKQIREIDDILNDMEKKYPGYGKILRLWYVDGEPKEKIAKKLNYSISSRKSIYRIKNQAIRVFAIRLFGLMGLKVM